MAHKMTSRSEETAYESQSGIDQNCPLHEDSSEEAMQISNLDNDGQRLVPYLSICLCVFHDAPYFWYNR